MQTTQLDLAPFGPQHLEGSVALSRQAGWPHRREDWEMAIALSTGVVALDEERVVGTTLTTLYGSDCATINMVIVAESMRGRGLGRRLMEAGLAAARGTSCRLIATEDGLPLYRKLDFHEIGVVLQHQGVCPIVEAPRDVEWATQADYAPIAAIDRQAFGADRGKLHTLRNGVDLERFVPQDRAQARQRLQLPPSGRLLLSVGHLIERKGHFVAI